MFGSDSGIKGGVSRRSVLFGGASAVAVGVLAWSGMSGAQAQEATPEPADGTPEADKQTLREKLEAYGYLWSATSPATHLGDVYTLVATNTGSAPVKLWVFTIVMDHRQHHNEVVIQEEVELAAGASRKFTATNEYGTANHFSTRIATDAADASALTLEVTVVDAGGQQTATFNQLAFMIDSREELQQRREERRAARRDRLAERRKHGGHGGADDDMDGMDEETATPDV
ncbi:MAG TPA: hypothetical protein VKB09_02160 [Thermomicrobiales bacterium]|nr:hypothetical protein [Thermomicrobiales bacterium]